MWPFSGIARNELAQSHTVISRLDVLRSQKKAYSLTVIDGSVSWDADRSVRGNAAVTVTDPTGALSGGDIDDLLSPYNCEIAPYRGVVRPDGKVEYAPLGVYQLTNRGVTGDGSVALSGQDRTIVYQGGMTASLSIKAGTAMEDALGQLLLTRNKSLQWKPFKTGFTVGPLLYAPDIDVWKEAQTLAQTVGVRLFHDRTGLLVMAPPLPSTPRAVCRYTEGDGLLLDATRQENNDTIHNVVVVQQEAGSAIRAVAQDTNPASPTYAGGKYGRRVVTITNASIVTIPQAQLAARNELLRQLGRSETVTISIVPDPTLDPLDAITINRPSADLNNRTLVIGKLTIPLSVATAMSVECRTFILTEDGYVLPNPDEFTQL